MRSVSIRIIEFYNFVWLKNKYFTCDEKWFHLIKKIKKKYIYIFGNYDKLLIIVDEYSNKQISRDKELGEI